MDIKEEHIKDYLYEEGARRMLLKRAKAKKIRQLSFLAIAASIILLAAFIFLKPYNKDNRDAIVLNYYEKPILSKSRSLDQSGINAYSEFWNKGDYEKIIKDFKGLELSERDQFYLAHAYFNSNQLEKSQQLILSNQWTDEFYIEDLEWLNFLIELKKRTENISQDRLSPEFKEKAQKILQEL